MSAVTKKLEGKSVQDAIDRLSRKGYTNTDIHQAFYPEQDSAIEVDDEERQLIVDEDFTGSLEEWSLRRIYRSVKEALSSCKTHNHKYPLAHRSTQEDLEKLADEYGDYELHFD